MRKLNCIVAAAALFGMFLMPSQSEAGVRVYVRIGPPRAHVVKVYRPARPYRDAIWVSGHYRYRHGRYVWTRGHYIRPRRGYIYVQPHWKHTRRGYFFATGRWVRR